MLNNDYLTDKAREFIFKTNGDVITDNKQIFEQLNAADIPVLWNDFDKVNLVNKYSLDKHLKEALSKKVWLKWQEKQENTEYFMEEQLSNEKKKIKENYKNKLEKKKMEYNQKLEEKIQEIEKEKKQKIEEIKSYYEVEEEKQIKGIVQEVIGREW